MTYVKEFQSINTNIMIEGIDKLFVGIFLKKMNDLKNYNLTPRYDYTHLKKHKRFENTS